MNELSVWRQCALASETNCFFCFFFFINDFKFLVLKSYYLDPCLEYIFCHTIYFIYNLNYLKISIKYRENKVINLFIDLFF